MHADLPHGRKPEGWSSSGVLHALNRLLHKLESLGERFIPHCPMMHVLVAKNKVTE